MAIAADEIIATAASPRRGLFSLMRSKRKAASITIGRATKRGDQEKIMAMAKAAKPTCERPSPIIA